ncbi:hypothetical protein Q5P01_010873 [Channa striata]|uniref:Uncharacterized protein n=1 Tax=Channa striata TaxID=64152 RepID=A0AA88SV24_CHASR|nr:hypothetical protein Q5P01_010873 [Channa striata]
MVVKPLFPPGEKKGVNDTLELPTPTRRSSLSFMEGERHTQPFWSEPAVRDIGQRECGSPHQRQPVHHLSSCRALLRVPVLQGERQWVRLEVRPGRGWESARRGEVREVLLSCCLETLQATWEPTGLSMLSDDLTNRAAVTSSVALECRRRRSACEGPPQAGEMPVVAVTPLLPPPTPPPHPTITTTPEPSLHHLLHPPRPPPPSLPY